ncbi:MAG: metal ABC transporter substrate-binding protein [Acidimicrobiia bacterium]
MITILNFRSTLRTAIVVLSVVLALVACGESQDVRPDGVSIVATTSIWGDVAAEIVGDDGTVEVLIPVGSDPHDYLPSARQIADLHRADLVIANGLGLEEGLVDVLHAAADDGVNVYELGPDLDPLPFHGGAISSAVGQDDGELDPHVWFDPNRVSRAAAAIADRLSEIEPGVDWRSKAESYVSRMRQLDAQIEDLIAAVPDSNRKLITNHDSLGYFAARYGFTVVGVVIPGGSTLAEPSSAELADLVTTIQEEGVPAIFAETTNASVLAEAVAAEAGRGIAVVELYTGSLGPSGSGADTLETMLLTDARLIADALS